jgi:NAD-dependent dihydropyrimidine dehydrogenase PreA subunit/predicted transcriptional regulator
VILLSINDVYVELRQQIDKMPCGMPATDSGVEIRILKHLFTPEEAKIALSLNVFPEPLKRIFNRVKKTDQAVTVEGLKEVLDRLVAKGSIMCDEKKGQKLYSYAMLAVGMYEFQANRLTKEFYEDCEEYFGEFSKEFFRTHVPQLRVIPVEKSITVENYVATYDEMRGFVKNAEGQFGVINCVCKQGKDLVGHKCKTTDVRETCLLFPAMTSSLMKNGTPFRLISKDETLEILQRAEKEGLVIEPSNSQEPLFVCCCCGDCCGVLTMAKMFPKPATLFATNYHAEVDNQLCLGCGVCLKRCQMEALTITNKKSSINLDRCIGCGLCVSTCPKKAIKLLKNEKVIVPPKNTDDLYKKILTKKVGNATLLKIGVKKIAGQKI